MTTWTIGDASVTKVLEIEVQWPFSALLPGGEDHIDDVEWLRPDFVTDEGRLRLTVDWNPVAQLRIRGVVHRWYWLNPTARQDFFGGGLSVQYRIGGTRLWARADLASREDGRVREDFHFSGGLSRAF